MSLLAEFLATTRTGAGCSRSSAPFTVACARPWARWPVRQDDQRAWKTTKLFYGGKRRKIRYKVVAGVYWQRGAGKRPLRLIVIAPTPYRKSKSKSCTIAPVNQRPA